ncbi:hypothetical protein GCM10025771_11670 [Niveibacterium umoris]|uniref:Uncharacterized protein n=1 Tax=Niveibacterium umoris TaxID=1193620 RepID=A0A840BP76_9RHOO|nr:hypothetical protein [Niveibacterium umoris]MBB4013279.1 hypothetical protein [Niveibacterium umoris]
MSQLLSQHARSQRRPRPLRIALALLLPLCAAIAHPARAADRPEVLWTEQQVLFWAEPQTGAVHAVGIRHGVSEFGVLRASQRRAVTQLSLDAQHAVLTVEGNDAIYRYDARSLRLLSRDTTRVARAAQLPHRWVE